MLYHLNFFFKSSMFASNNSFFPFLTLRRECGAHATIAPRSWCMCRDNCNVGYLSNGHGSWKDHCPGLYNFLSLFYPFILFFIFYMESMLNSADFEIQTERSPYQYRGMFHALGTVFREEGFRALYKGWLPSVIGVVSLSLFLSATV